MCQCLCCYLYIYMYICTYICTYVCMYVHGHHALQTACMGYVYVFIYLYIHISYIDFNNSKKYKDTHVGPIWCCMDLYGPLWTPIARVDPWDPCGPLCWFLGMSRNLVAHVDIATLAAIAICVCKQKLCKICRRSGKITQHFDHDKIFGGRRIILQDIILRN